jgi:P27 family predicted phage terminase small subunit
LAPAGQAFWRELVAVLDSARVLTSADITALVMLCEAWSEYRAADDVVQAEGLTYTAQTASGHIVRPHPCVAIRADAWRRVERMLGKFGLNPSDRTRVKQRPPAAESDPSDGYFEGRGPRLHKPKGRGAA